MGPATLKATALSAFERYAKHGDRGGLPEADADGCAAAWDAMVAANAGYRLRSVGGAAFGRCDLTAYQGPVSEFVFEREAAGGPPA